jgi:hypothetical protein
MCCKIYGCKKSKIFCFLKYICFVKVHDRIGKQLTNMTLQQQPTLQNQQANDPSRVVGSYK